MAFDILSAFLGVSKLGFFGYLVAFFWIGYNFLMKFCFSDFYLYLGIFCLGVIILVVCISKKYLTRNNIGKYLPFHFYLILLTIFFIILYAIISGNKDLTQMGILIATIIYAGITYSLTKFTKDLAETTEKATKLQNQPFMTANLRENDIDFHYIDLIIENIGQGIAKNILFNLESPETLIVPSKYHHKIEEMEIFNRGIQSLGPHQNIRFVLVNLPEIVGTEKHISEVNQDDFKFKLTISCENIEGQKCLDQKYELDLLIFWGLVYIQKPPVMQLIVTPVTQSEES
jgi:hypothetical protein